ncbi:hypothetical protein LJC42_00425 [Eubacteriales bacterium OttesenSCG-928-K08]|nr:hypothetical protein [Eubacteriales bacterium OttesenSCG-928-K08]
MKKLMIIIALICAVCFILPLLTSCSSGGSETDKNLEISKSKNLLKDTLMDNNYLVELMDEDESLTDAEEGLDEAMKELAEKLFHLNIRNIKETHVVGHDENGWEISVITDSGRVYCLILDKYGFLLQAMKDDIVDGEEVYFDATDDLSDNFLFEDLEDVEKQRKYYKERQNAK